jgi:hypothetical protein
MTGFCELCCIFDCHDPFGDEEPVYVDLMKHKSEPEPEPEYPDDCPF